jgi:excisionase family DNA binding protein
MGQQSNKIKHLANVNSAEILFARFQNFLEVFGETVEGLEDRIEGMHQKMDSLVASDDNKLYSPEEVAALLSTEKSSVHRNTVLKWIKCNKLAYLSGTKYKIPGKAIKKFIAENTRYQDRI